MNTRRPVLMLVLGVLLAGPVLAQQGRGRGPAPPGMKGYPQAQGPVQSRGGMSQEERERFRQELNSARRDAYREQGAESDARRSAARPMAPEERERLRRDILDANRAFGRRR